MPHDQSSQHLKGSFCSLFFITIHNCSDQGGQLCKFCLPNTNRGATVQGKHNIHRDSDSASKEVCISSYFNALLPQVCKKQETLEVCSKMPRQSLQRVWNTCSALRDQLLHGMCYGSHAIPPRGAGGKGGASGGAELPSTCSLLPAR